MKARTLVKKLIKDIVLLKHFGEEFVCVCGLYSALAASTNVCCFRLGIAHTPQGDGLPTALGGSRTH